MYIRVLLTLIIVLLGLYQLTSLMETKQYVLFYLAVLILSNFALGFLPAARYEGTKFHYIIFLLDIIFIGLGAYWLASLDFLFFMLIFLTIFISALSQSVGLSVLVAVVINVLYFYIKTTNAGEGAVMPQGTLLNMPFLFMVALHASYLAEKSSEDIDEKKRLQKSNQQLSGKLNEMSEDMQNAIADVEKIYDSFREGIIILDANGVIRQFNAECENIFGIKRNKVKNFLYREAGALGDVAKCITDMLMKRIVSSEKIITVNSENGLRHLVVNTGIIGGKEGIISGYLCTIRTWEGETKSGLKQQ
jgi:PAS domain-containing protein